MDTESATGHPTPLCPLAFLVCTGQPLHTQHVAQGVGRRTPWDDRRVGAGGQHDAPFVTALRWLSGAGRHSCLCVSRQCSRWQSLSQYPTRRQRLQVFKVEAGLRCPLQDWCRLSAVPVASAASQPRVSRLLARVPEKPATAWAAKGHCIFRRPGRMSAGQRGQHALLLAGQSQIT